MKIYYQGEPGSYSHLASQEISKLLNLEIEDIVGELDFDTVWNRVSDGEIGVLPIENSYAGSIHHNVYNFLKYDHKIIGEYNFEVQHCLMSLEDDITKVKFAYSHHQALSQTYQYLKKNNIISKPYADTAGAAKMIAEKQKMGVAAVASSLAAELYGLNILESQIQDQPNNTTKFLIIVKKDCTDIEFQKKKGRLTLIFNTHHTPGSLYNCLGVFAEKHINVTKIESIPMQTGHFSYAFWVTLDTSTHLLGDTLELLKNHAKNIHILGAY